MTILHPARRWAAGLTVVVHHGRRGGDKQSEHAPRRATAPRPPGRAVQLRRHAARPDAALRRGRADADLRLADAPRRHRRQRPDPGLPAQHRPGLVHAGHRRRGRACTAAPTTPSSTTGSRSPASTSFSFHGNGASPGSDPTNVLEAQSVASSAELAGKKVAQLEWTGGLNANINGPTVDYATFYSQRGVLEYPANADQAGRRRRSSACPTRSRRSPRRPAGPTCRRAPSRPQQTTLTVTSTSAALNPNRTYDLYVYASGTPRLRPGRAWCPSGGGQGRRRRRPRTLTPGRRTARSSSRARTA